MEGLDSFQKAKLDMFTWGSDECIARYAEAEKNNVAAQNPLAAVSVGNHPCTICPSPVKCYCAPSALGSSFAAWYLYMDPPKEDASSRQISDDNNKKKQKKQKTSADGIEQEAQSKEIERGDKESEKERREEKSRDEVKEKRTRGAKTRNVKGESENREESRGGGHEKEREAKRDEEVEEAEESSMGPGTPEEQCRAAGLCAQCTKAVRSGRGEGWCDSLECAFLRGYDLIDSLLVIMRSFVTQLHGNKSEVITQLLPLYSQAEASATSLLWRMCVMIK